ncbi:MAG TPA: hypothetical protein VMW93_00495 [bacterium]|nr:hypothetical protein [bacterium]
MLKRLAIAALAAGASAALGSDAVTTSRWLNAAAVPAGGVYVYRIRAGDDYISGKVAILK